MSAEDRIIVALDVASLDEAISLVDQLMPVGISHFKVGMELVTGVGLPTVAETIHKRGGKVFADVKLHDIPTTMARTSKQLADLGVWMFSVHASSGLASISSAVQNKGSAKVFVVTVLTSLSRFEAFLIYGVNVGDQVFSFAWEASTQGVDGVICSPWELQLLKRSSELDKLDFVTPGVRPFWVERDDQERAMTPREAVKAGATALVIGRPIIRPPREIGTPAEAAKRICEDIESALTS